MVAGQSIWFMLLAYGCSFLGALQVPAFMAAITYSAVGFVYNWKQAEAEEADESVGETTENQSIFERCRINRHFWESPIIKSTPNRQQIGATVQPSSVQSISSPSPLATDESDPALVLKNRLELNLKTTFSKPTTPIDDDHDDQLPKSQSAVYFKALFVACLVTILYKQLIVVALSFIPVLLYISKNIIVTFGIKEYLSTTIDDLYALVQVSKK